MPEPLVRAQQALYGYVDGHRLLASSTKLDEEAQRTLRSLTDVAFDGKATSYLTICPLPTQGAHAFIKTWPADPWTRPGSVWSHVLIVDRTDLGTLQGLQGIADEFRRPATVELSLPAKELQRYQQELDVSASENVRVSLQSVETALAGQLYSELYDRDEKVRFKVDTASDYEDLLLAVFEQQWPRLRRTFSCRTRQRATSVKFDLEIIEQVHPRDTPKAAQTLPSWAEFPAADLLAVDPNYRRFLNLCGAESARGRQDFRPVTEVYQTLTTVEATPKRTVQLITTSFPDPETQRGLKRMLFGPNNETRVVQARRMLGNWPTQERDLVSLAAAAAPALDLEHIELGSRLVDLYRLDPSQESPLRDLDLESLQPHNVQALIGGITSRAEPSTAIAVAVAQPDLGLLMTAQNKNMLGVPAIWQHLDNDLLLELLDSPEEPNLRSFVTDQLLDQGAIEALARICSVDSDEWWRLLLRSARRDDASFYGRAQTLRQVLERLGTGALNSPPDKPTTAQELLTLLLAADLSSGLWRRAGTGDWINTARLMDENASIPAPRQARERLAAAALVSAIQSGSAARRMDGWRTCFPFLHQALRSDSFDGEAWSLLSTTLPAGPEWDRCERLRRGVAQEIKRDKWPIAHVQAAVVSAKPDSESLIALLQERSGKRKKDHWFKQLVKLFS